MLAGHGGPADGLDEQVAAEPLTLPALVDGQAGEQHHTVGEFSLFGRASAAPVPASWASLLEDAISGAVVTEAPE